MRGMLPLFAVLAVAVAGCGGAHKGSQQTTTGAASDSLKQARADPPVRRLVTVAAGRLDAPVQDAAAAPHAGGAVLVGGLTPADVSSDAIVSATRAGSARIGRIPTALHDSAAVQIGGAVYLFGGGTATTQLDTILMIDPRTGAAQAAGHLPTDSSDQAAAAIGRTAYIVGGYTGGRWLDTVVAWRPGGTARVVARLPHTLRYAAVTAVGKRLIIAGGSLESGAASDTVYEYIPPAGHVIRLGRLPAQTTHAAAAAIGSLAFVIGG